MAMTIAEETYINNAIGKARGAYNNAIATARRNALRTGVNPSSGKFQALENSAQYSAAAGIASAATDASFNWLKQAQAQQNFDDEMAFKQEQFDFKKDQAEKANAFNWAQFDFKKDATEAAYMREDAAAKAQADALTEENRYKAEAIRKYPIKAGMTSEELATRNQKINDYVYLRKTQSSGGKKKKFGFGGLGTSGKGLLK